MHLPVPRPFSTPFSTVYIVSKVLPVTPPRKSFYSAFALRLDLQGLPNVSLCAQRLPLRLQRLLEQRPRLLRLAHFLQQLAQAAG